MSDMEEVNSGPKPAPARPPAHAAFEGRVAEAVIGGALLRVLQHVIGFVDFLEFVLGRLVAGIGIGMILLGELAEGALQLLLVGAFR